ncbi:MAG: M20/M25/M40 family metallo-hydrolase [Desulfosarcina sp.]|nr:M20/M25/M40 family metallo-hydrolase [Desulfobacterales bacterium]
MVNKLGVNKLGINRSGLTERFMRLVRIDSVSKEEGAISDEIIKTLKDLGAETTIDGAGDKIGGQTGNIVARFQGNVDVPAILLSAHMDTVEPGRGIRPVFKDGLFRSDGTTILGADDKSALAIIFEVMDIIKERDLPCGPVELVITVCEEIGLLGVKNLDFSLLSAKFGYVLDSAETFGIVTRAPAANRFEFKIHGKDAHAGASPEKGINAIQLAGKAVSKIHTGRIDDETTCNIGMIKGGVATNIVPNLVTVKGEVRSHNKKKLDDLISEIVSCFKEIIEEYKSESGEDALPALEVLIENDFPLLKIPDDHLMISLACNAAENLGKKMVTKTTGGGSDANIFFEQGLITGVLGTGMRDVHTVRENILLDDMVDTAELLLEIIKLHSETGAMN